MAINYTFGNYSEPYHYDWKDVDEVGIDSPAYLLTGVLSGGDYQRNKQIIYQTTHFGKTEVLIQPDPPPPDLPWQSIVDSYDAAVAGGAVGLIDIYTAMIAAAPTNADGSSPLARAKIVIAETSPPDSAAVEHGASPLVNPEGGSIPLFGEMYFQTNALITGFSSQASNGDGVYPNSLSMLILGGPQQDIVVTGYQLDGTLIGSTVVPFSSGVPGLIGGYAIVPNPGEPVPPSVLDDMVVGQTYYVEVTAA